MKMLSYTVIQREEKTDRIVPIVKNNNFKASQFYFFVKRVRHQISQNKSAKIPYSDHQ